MRDLKQFEGFPDKPPIFYRPGTSDTAIINSVFINQQEYLFPPFKPKTVFDMGANIGVTAVILANVYPDAQIYSFEPEPENFSLLEMNARSYPNVKCFNYGLSNDSGAGRLYPSTDPVNLGGFSTHIKNGPGTLVALRDIAEVCQELGTPDLIKIDVEGAENHILRAMPNIEKVGWITGELHDIEAYGLLAYLSINFHLQFKHEFGDAVWHFQALNRAGLGASPDATPQQ